MDAFDGGLRLVKVEVDTAAPELADRFDVQSIPFMAVFAGGELVTSAVGARSRRKLVEELELARVVGREPSWSAEDLEAPDELDDGTRQWSGSVEGEIDAVAAFFVTELEQRGFVINEISDDGVMFPDDDDDPPVTRSIEFSMTPGTIDGGSVLVLGTMPCQLFVSTTVRRFKNRADADAVFAKLDDLWSQIDD